MKPTLTLVTALLLVASFSALKAADKISHRLLVTDYGGNRVCIVSAAGEIEWEYPVSRSRPRKKVVWEFADHARVKTVCRVQIIDTPADPLKGEVLR